MEQKHRRILGTPEGSCTVEDIHDMMKPRLFQVTFAAFWFAAVTVPTLQAADAEDARPNILIGKERHDVGRRHDWGFPVRGIVKGGVLNLRNFEPTRWPAGNPETGYLNTDGSPTKTVILDGRTNPQTERFWQWSFGKRPS